MARGRAARRGPDPSCRRTGDRAHPPAPGLRPPGSGAARVLNLNDGVAEIEELLRRTVGADMELVDEPARQPVADLRRPGPARAGARQSGHQRPRRHARRRHPAHRHRQHRRRRRLGGRRTARPTPGRYVRLRVSDTGTGMSSRRHRARLRAVLHHQGRRQRNRPRPGHRLRHRHPRPKRRSRIQSEPGVGTTFTIMFPVTDEAEGRRRGAPSPYDRTTQGRDHPRRRGRRGAPRGHRTDLRPRRLPRAITAAERRRGHPPRRAATRARSTCSSPTSSCPRCSARKWPNASSRSARTSGSCTCRATPSPSSPPRAGSNPASRSSTSRSRRAALLAKAGHVLNDHLT